MFKRRFHAIYARLMRPRRPRRRKPTDRGRMLQAGLIVSATIGLDTDLNLIYQVFALLLCLLLVARVSLRLHPPTLKVERELPRQVTANEGFTYQIRLTNLGRRREIDLQLTDNPAVRVPARDAYLLAREPGEETRNAYDRFIGFHRFAWLQRLTTGLTTQTAKIDDLPGCDSVLVSVAAMPLRRGRVHFTSTTLLHPDPLNLYFGQVHIDNPTSLLVLPRRYQISPHLSLPGGPLRQTPGQTSNPGSGSSDEFMALRDYRDGDTLRNIHWPSTARRGEPVIKEFHREAFCRQALILDSTLPPSPQFEDAISVAASLVLAMNTTGGASTLIYLSDQPRTLAVDDNAQSSMNQLAILAELDSSPLPFSDLAELALRATRGMSACVLILGSWEDDRQQLVRQLRGAQLPLTVFVVTATREPIANLPADVHCLPAGQVQEALNLL